MLKLYLASHYERREELVTYRNLFQDNGHLVTSRWLDGEQDTEKWITGEYGKQDLEDIDVSQFMIAFTDLQPHTRGGLQYEIGYAQALDPQRIFIVGPKMNVFHQMLPSTRVYDSPVQLLPILNDIDDKFRLVHRILPPFRPSNPISMYEIYRKTYLEALSPEQWRSLYENRPVPNDNSFRRGRYDGSSDSTTERRDSDIASVYDRRTIT